MADVTSVSGGTQVPVVRLAGARSAPGRGDITRGADGTAVGSILTPQPSPFFLAGSYVCPRRAPGEGASGRCTRRAGHIGEPVRAVV